MRWSAFILTAMVLAGCIADNGDGNYDDEYEEEPTGSSESAVISKVDCKTTTMTAYDRGKPYSIEVVTVGAKRAARPTAHAFLKMQKAAHAAKVSLTMNSGFRTQEEQEYFYDCYKTKKCNNGNLAARPGYSNHQNGRALDLSTSKWLTKNAGKFGFERTVPSEPWHYEFTGKDPGGPCSTEPADDAGAPPENDAGTSPEDDAGTNPELGADEPAE